MARSSIKIVQVLRETAKRIKQGAPYQWGHMGSCNCGHLAQTITKLSKGEIHKAAMQRYGDWSEQLRDYCPQSGLPLNEMIDSMLELGFTRSDLINLERLKAPEVLAQLPEKHKYLKHNLRDDVVLYLNTWANLIEKDLVQKVTDGSLNNQIRYNKLVLLDA